MWKRLSAILPSGDVSASDNSFVSREDSEDDPTPSLSVLMCKYRGRTLERQRVCVGTTDYIAISHAWGNARWQYPPGMEQEILVSDEKAKFIAEQLNGFVGDDWFWMDVLCVNQKDDAARIAVTQHIPTIFRNAQKTIVVRESWGLLGPCCLKEVKNQAIFLSATLPDKLYKHLANAHQHEDYREGILTRLWLYQEIVLSDNIQFVRSAGLGEKRQKRIKPRRLTDYSMMDFGVNYPF